MAEFVTVEEFEAHKAQMWAHFRVRAWRIAASFLLLLVVVTVSGYKIAAWGAHATRNEARARALTDCVASQRNIATIKNAFISVLSIRLPITDRPLATDELKDIIKKTLDDSLIAANCNEVKP